MTKKTTDRMEVALTCAAAISVLVVVVMWGEMLLHLLTRHPFAVTTADGSILGLALVITMAALLVLHIADRA